MFVYIFVYIHVPHIIGVNRILGRRSWKLRVRFGSSTLFLQLRGAIRKDDVSCLHAHTDNFENEKSGRRGPSWNTTFVRRRKSRTYVVNMLVYMFVPNCLVWKVKACSSKASTLKIKWLERMYTDGKILFLPILQQHGWTAAVLWTDQGSFVTYRIFSR